MANNRTYKDEMNETCLSMEELVALAKGEAGEVLSLKAHRHMESCELCRDAWEGLNAFNDPDVYHKAVKDINQRIDRSTIVSDIKYKKSRPMLLFSAAAVLLVFIIASLFIFVFRDHTKGNLAKNEMTEEEEVLAREAGNNDRKVIEETSTDAAEKKADFDNQAPIEEVTANMDVGEKNEQAVISDNKAERDAELLAVEDDEFPDYSGANKETINENLVVNEAKSGGYVIASKSKKSENKKGVTGLPLAEGQDDLKDKKLDENYMKQAYSNLESQNYLSALYFSKLILDRDPTNREAQLLAGISNYYLGNYEVSDKQLEGVIETPSDSLSFEGMWFLSNSMVKQNKIEQAEQMLQKLATERNHYRKDAADLLESIKK